MLREGYRKVKSAVKVGVLAGAVLTITFGVIISSNDPSSVDTHPTGAVGSTLKIKESATICLQVSRELEQSWPILDAAYNWNNNGLNKFTTSTETEDCDGIVLISQSDTNQWYGNTEFYFRDTINVQLSTKTAIPHRGSVICHELGHVLGLPHNSDTGSCMNIASFYHAPTEKDLTTVSQDKWRAAVAKNRMNK